MSKVIILDIDGPMIPVRSYFLNNQSDVYDVFDQCAVAMLNRLIRDSNATIVISSTWATRGLQVCNDLLKNNGIIGDLHPDWHTPRKMTSSRTHEVQGWLREHPNITHSVVLDDEILDAKILPTFVQCDPYEGMSYRNYLEARVHLDVATKEDLEMLHYLRRREIWRTQRRGDALESYTWEVADKMFPVSPTLDIHWYRGFQK